eukprot:TRINITY_DN11222_c0_g1_i3.p1 TRINITY_DN11222_c0_g1~~TRINITY_DN11222_c0_g1_i3.p1  ORF type:complete len:110 (-),score=27.72 TRINITY_DN11222_c0_g1_i3:35-364(-)
MDPVPFSLDDILEDLLRMKESNVNIKEVLERLVEQYSSDSSSPQTLTESDESYKKAMQLVGTGNWLDDTTVKLESVQEQIQQSRKKLEERRKLISQFPNAFQDTKEGVK